MTVDQKLQQVFESVLNAPVTISDDTVASEIPGWDSVAHINLMFGIEQAFGIQFRGDELSGFQNVGELKRYLERHAQIKMGS